VDGSRDRSLVVLGFGAIGAGLFIYEAMLTGAYAPPLLIDVRADLIGAVRADGGRFAVNIAWPDRVEVATLGPVRLADSSVAGDRQAAIAAIAAADELASALPSVAFYRREAPTSPHRLLAAALQRRTQGPPLIVYCAENHRSAAALLREAVLGEVPAAERPALAARVRFVDTVIGKMSGVITAPDELAAGSLAPIASSLEAAFLVESFDRILVSRVDPDGDRHPGIPVLREVDDLAPFEDAKLLGHNATHALAGFLGQLLGLALVADLRDVPGAMAFLRQAFIAESGGTLIARHAGADPLFTPAGYAAFADDLLERMVNPYLADRVDRAARDPRRKLGWEDRLVGLLRLGLEEGVATPRYAMGVAAALDVLRGEGETGTDRELLRGGWPPDLPADAVDAVLAAVAAGRDWLERWRAGGFGVVA
jgi:mannitol-1-phosphate 5-dehydrogenase